MDLSQSPSMQDGFNGARDARLLAEYGHVKGMDRGVFHIAVMAVPATKELLQRAGIRRPSMGDRHTVRCIHDGKYMRFLLAPVEALEAA